MNWKQPITPPLEPGDLMDAMSELTGYLDITPEDLGEIFQLAYDHAIHRLTKGVTVAQAMSRAVVAAEPDMPLDQVARLMADHKVSGLPVLEHGRVVGMVSESDIITQMSGSPGSHFMSVVANCLAGKACRAAPLRGKAAGEIMSAPAITLSPETPLWKAMDTLRALEINRAPVVDETGMVVGIVTRADLMRLSGSWNQPSCEENGS